MKQADIHGLVDIWQERLGLNAWKIAVTFTNDAPQIDDGSRCNMVMHRSEFYKRASLHVADFMVDMSAMPPSIEKDLIDRDVVTHDEHVEVTIVHELLHLHFRDVMEASDLIRDDVHPSLRQTWDAAFKRAEENAVESLAQALVENWGPAKC